ncbi:MAG: excinuclease ABC subunit C [Candidatus Marinimicrobia bacterium]|nr:excinuclease ABC subunit C [Candidatus Neomarinimicrobiota bacterium]
MDVKEILSQIPTSPGVYFYRNDKDEIIYIGKAKVLRNRVRSYFQKSKNIDAKTQVMVKHIAHIDWLVVRDEVDALLTEANMIKAHRPRYNVLLKDDKTFPYVRITNEPYPRVEIIRAKHLTKDKHIYFGPYTDAGYLRELLRSLHKIFPIRTCNYYIDATSIAEKKVSVCLDYHIKRCEGPCEGLVSERHYGDMIHQIKQFLKGRNDNIKRHLKDSMTQASDELRFEDAGRYRDQYEAVVAFTQRQKLLSQDFMDRDILAISAELSYGVGVLMRIRNGHLIGREKFQLKVADADDRQVIMSQFFIQYYNATADLPKEILLDTSVDDREQFEKWLSGEKGSKVNILVPERGEKKKLVDTCAKNAELHLASIRFKKIKRKEHVPKMVAQLQEDLGLEAPPRRIEAFDNSNIQGAHAVAGMVCFIDGKPRKSEYRKFNIKTVDGIDDFASMREVVGRRYKRVLDEQKPLPDLILIDGGKGQLSAAKSALDVLGLGYVPIIGLAKRLEEVFKPEIAEPQNIAKSSPGLHLLRQLRDEVHRFAITFHRSKRDKKMTLSIFEDIPGMGKKRVQKLWEVFESLDHIKSSSVETIKSKCGFSEKLAIAIKGKIGD